MTTDEWLQEAMRQINALTPNVTGKAFDPDWFLLRNHLEDGVSVLVHDAIAAEREACAKVCDPLNDRPEDWTEHARIKAECAAAIRKRSNEPS